ncbi:MAG: hypothetical protein H6839_18040 [Planctomycetes bacterium]|nr:hypothetical protein [Planctomycetota bacterium]
MDREQAHRLLGLYLGAPPEHVEAKYKALLEELQQQLGTATDAGARSELQGQIDALGVARNAALGLPEDASMPQLSGMQTAGLAHTPAWRRGPVVLLFLLMALTLAVIGFYLAAHSLDQKQAARITNGQRDRAVAAQQAWQGYRKKIGLAETPDGERAEALMAGAQKLDSDGDAQHAGEDYATALELFQAAFAAENGRLAQKWKSDVVEPWQKKLKGRFPFSQTGEEEADPDDVARLFNPVSGTVWSTQREYDALRSTELEGLNLATLPKGFEKTLEQARRIRVALFGADNERISVVFSIRVEAKSLLELGVETGGVRVSNREKNFVTANWTPETAGARIGGRKAGDRDPEAGPVDYWESSWGALQLLNYCSFEGEQDGAHVWSFEIDGTDERRKPRTLSGTIHIKVDREFSPFDFGTYSGFAPE